MLLTRRDFLQQTAILTAATSLRAAIAFPKEPRQRLSVTSYPFRAYIESPTNKGRKPELPGMDLKRFPGLMAEKFGIHNVNPLMDHFASTESAYLKDFQRALAGAGSHIVDLGLAGGSFYSPDQNARNSGIALGRKGVNVAAVLGCPSVRQHVQGRKGEQPNVERAAETLGQLAEYGRSHGVVINLENDNPVAEDPFFLVAVIEKVNSPFLRGLPDFGNSLIDHDAAFNERAVSAMLKHALNMCHVKDVVESDAGQPATVDLKRTFELAEANAYRGYFSMEFDTGQGDPYTGTARLVRETLQYLK